MAWQSKHRANHRRGIAECPRTVEAARAHMTALTVVVRHFGDTVLRQPSRLKLALVQLTTNYPLHTVEGAAVRAVLARCDEEGRLSALRAWCRRHPARVAEAIAAAVQANGATRAPL